MAHPDEMTERSECDNGIGITDFLWATRCYDYITLWRGTPMQTDKWRGREVGRMELSLFRDLGYGSFEEGDNPVRLHGKIPQPTLKTDHSTSDERCSQKDAKPVGYGNGHCSNVCCVTWRNS